MPAASGRSRGVAALVVAGVLFGSTFLVVQDAVERAAVSGFGFGGVNAHLLLEEWLARDPRYARVHAEDPAFPDYQVFRVVQ